MSIELFRALAHKHRYVVYKMLEAGPLTKGEIARRLGISIAHLSYHIARLKDAGLVIEYREGYRKYLRLSKRLVVEVWDSSHKNTLNKHTIIRD